MSKGETKKVQEKTEPEVIKEIDNLQESMLDVLNFHPLLDNIWIKSAVVFAAVLLLALFVRLVLFLVLKKITGKTRNSLDNKIVTKLQSPVFISILLFGLSLALRTLDLSKEVLSASNKVLLTILFLLWMFKGISIVKMVLTHLAHTDNEKRIIKMQTLPLFLNLSFVLILILFVYMIMSTWNVDMTALVASAGVLGIAIGFAAKDTLANLISGVLILADQPYKIGDFVVLEGGQSGNERGEITHIGIRSTRMRTRDDVEVTVPNSIMGNSMIINESGGPYVKFRIRLQVGVAYGTELARVRETLLDVANTTDNVCETPEPRVRLRNFGPSSLEFELLCWVPDPVLKGRVIDELYEKIYMKFGESGLEIPFQQVDLHIKDNAPSRHFDSK